jgi:hypothetical protein
LCLTLCCSSVGGACCQNFFPRFNRCRRVSHAKQQMPSPPHKPPPLPLRGITLALNKKNSEKFYPRCALAGWGGQWLGSMCGALPRQCEGGKEEKRTVKML